MAGKGQARRMFKCVRQHSACINRKNKSHGKCCKGYFVTPQEKKRENYSLQLSQVVRGDLVSKGKDKVKLEGSEEGEGRGSRG